MALVKWSAIVSEMRGKMNGTVFARNRYANYARNKVTPYNPQTPAQQNIRMMFAQLSKTWRQLTQDERDAWNRAVEEFLKTNIFGDTYRPAGYNLFIRINMNLFLIGQPMITLPPVPVVVDSIRIIKTIIEASTNTFDIIVEVRGGMTHIPLSYVSRPLSPGISFVKSEFRLIEHTIEFTSPNQYILHIGAQYKMKYGPLSNFIGQRLFYKITPIDKKTGLNGVSVQNFSIIQ
jgi:hypothetical protein